GDLDLRLLAELADGGLLPRFAVIDETTREGDSAVPCAGERATDAQYAAADERHDQHRDGDRIEVADFAARGARPRPRLRFECSAAPRTMGVTNKLAHWTSCGVF